MMETSGRKIIFYFPYPLVGKDFTTRIAEASFKGARNNYILPRVLWTGIFMITQLFGITTREHLFYCVDDLLAKRILMLR
jgi:hypothetical protein